MLRTSILREKEVRSKVAQARKQRKIGTTMTLNTQMVTTEMMKIRQRTKSKKNRQKKRTKKNPTATTMSGMDKKTRKNQNLLTTTS